MPNFQIWGDEPDLKVEERVVQDITHTFLCLVGANFEWTVRADCDTDTKAESVKSVLGSLNVNMNMKVHKKKQNSTKIKSESKNHFIGAHCGVLLEHFQQLLDLHAPPAKKHVYETSWFCLGVLWNSIVEPMPDTPQNRETKALNIESKAREFKQAFLAQGGNGTPYLHKCEAHTGDQIRIHGTDLKHLSTQGGEHLNKLSAQWGHRHSNHRSLHIGLYPGPPAHLSTFPSVAMQCQLSCLG